MAVGGDVPAPDRGVDPERERGGAFGAGAFPALRLLAAEVLLDRPEGVLDGPAGVVLGDDVGGVGVQVGGEEEVVALDPGHVADDELGLGGSSGSVGHFSLGGMWGTAYGIAANAGLSGQKAVHMVFATVYTGDVILNTVLGLYRPTEWSSEDWIVDLVDKYVQAQATGLIFDRLLSPAPRS